MVLIVRMDTKPRKIYSNVVIMEFRSKCTTSHLLYNASRQLPSSCDNMRNEHPNYPTKKEIISLDPFAFAQDFVLITGIADCI